MSDIPEEYYFTKEHEWIKEDGGKCLVGISAYAQEELGDVVFVDLPEEGVNISQGESMFTVESVKAVSDVYAPVSGKILRGNEELSNAPELINSDPFQGGWMVEITLDDGVSLAEAGLMDSEAYKAYLAEVVK